MPDSRVPADHHARRAEDLTTRAMSTSMRGWVSRRRRLELLTAAQVHATLAARPLEPAAVDTELETARMETLERDRDSARARAGILDAELEQVRRILKNYSAPALEDGVAESLEALLERLTVGRDLEPPRD